MKLELRNVKISKQFSEETILFSADLYVNGKTVAYANNDGRGGCTFYNAYPDRRDLLIEAEEYAKTLPSEFYEFGGKTHEIKSTLENWIDKQVHDIFNQKEIAIFNKTLKKNCETKICWGVKNGNTYSMIGFSGRQKLTDLMKTIAGKTAIQNLIKDVKGKLKEGEIILNENIDLI